MEENMMAEYIIEGLKYIEPKQPHKSSIRGYDLPKKKQIWLRHTEYDQWDWNTDPEEGSLWYENPEEGQMEWYEEEISRINNGEWVMIDGTPTYINKYCYFYHQWYTHSGGIYSQFRFTSLDFFRFWEIIDNDPTSLGCIGIKGRRLGMSSMAASLHLMYMLTESDNLQGIVSKQAVDAKELFLMTRNALENLPEFLMPSIRVIGEKEIHLATPRERHTKQNQKINKDKGLNNRLNWLAPAENAYDGRELRFLVLDEAAKYEECDIRKLFSKVTETLLTGATVVGKILMFSTVNAPHLGGEEFEELWRISDHEDSSLLDEYGSTPTKMKRYFVPGYVGVQGYIDAYGRSVVENPTPEQSEYLKNLRHPKTGVIMCKNPAIGSKEFREQQRKHKGRTPEDLAEEKRKFPFTWEEAFDSANNRCHFDIDNINSQIEVLKDKLVELGRDIEKGELGRRGWFYKNQATERVKFFDDPEGMWYVDELLPETESNKFTIHQGKQVPTNEIYGAAGLDPIDAGRVTVDKGSDACCIIRKRESSLNPDTSGKPVAMLLGRPKNNNILHEQVYNGLIYYGVKMLAETTPRNWLQYAQDKKLTGYLYGREKSNGVTEYGISPQGENVKKEHLEAMQYSSLWDWNKIPFIRLLRDRKLFNIKDRTDYDCTMADGYALIALKEPYKKQTQKKIDIRKLWKGGRVINL